MIYMVDIDNTICNTPVINGTSDYEAAIPISDRINKINQLYDDGNKIIYWSGRGSASGKDRTLLTKTQLSEWGCKYHELRLYKPVYDIFIDDKAVNSEEYFK